MMEGFNRIEVCMSQASKTKMNFQAGSASRNKDDFLNGLGHKILTRWAQTDKYKCGRKTYPSLSILLKMVNLMHEHLLQMFILFIYLVTLFILWTTLLC